MWEGFKKVIAIRHTNLICIVKREMKPNIRLNSHIFLITRSFCDITAFKNNSHKTKEIIYGEK